MKIRYWDSSNYSTYHSRYVLITKSTPINNRVNIIPERAPLNIASPENSSYSLTIY